MSHDLTKHEDLTRGQAILVAALKVTHLLIIAFVVFGWALPWRAAHFVHLAFIPIMVLHWKTFDGCILTVMECRIKRIPPPTDEDESPFVEWVLRTTFGWTPTQAVRERLIDVVVWTSWGLSAVRLLAGS